MVSVLSADFGINVILFQVSNPLSRLLYQEGDAGMATTGALMAGLAFTATLFNAGSAPAQDEVRTLVLHVDNYARLPSDVLARAEREAARVYEAAGVRVVWIHGDDEAERDAGGRHLRVLLLGTEMTHRKTAVDRIGPDVLGSAARGTDRAYVFTQRIIEVALKGGRDASMMLGRVMAHEIGHLLLSEIGHSPRGIMRAHLDLRNAHFDTFTNPQAREILLALNR
jgi:hypothetical protein